MNDLAAEQLEEAKQSKATAISLGRPSNWAFLYLPLNFVCALLGMNLSIFGQGTVPVWVFLSLLVFFSISTYLPIFMPPVKEQTRQGLKLAVHLAGRSILAGFWYVIFLLTHNYQQNFEIMNSGLTQVFLGYNGARTRGWHEQRRDGLFTNASWGSEGFWKQKVRMIFLSVKELNPGNQERELAV